jgi:hypothetical protein
MSSIASIFLYENESPLNLFIIYNVLKICSDAIKSKSNEPKFQTIMH